MSSAAPHVPVFYESAVDTERTAERIEAGLPDAQVLHLSSEPTFRAALLCAGVAASRQLDLCAPTQSADAPRAVNLPLVDNGPDAAEAMAFPTEISVATARLARLLAQARAALSERKPSDAVVTHSGLPRRSRLHVAARASRPIPMIALSCFGGPEDERATRQRVSASTWSTQLQPRR